MGFTDNYSKKVPSTTLNKSHGEQKGISGRRTSGVSNNPTDDSLLFNIFHENDDSVDGTTNSSALIPDQEILDSTESIYFLENADTNIYELKVNNGGFCIRKVTFMRRFQFLWGKFQFL